VPSIREDQEIRFNITFNDDDGNNTASVQWYQQNGSLDFDPVSTLNNYTFVGDNGTTAGEYKIYASVSDGLSKVNSSFWNLTVIRVVDTDGDGYSDYTDNCKLVSNSNQADTDDNGIGDACEDDLDGDGVDDGDDFIDGDVNTIEATDSSGDAIALTFTIDNDEDINQSISGTKLVALTTTTIDPETGDTIVEPLIEFDHDFGSTTKLDLSNISLKEETRVIDGSSVSTIVVSGVGLASGETKTIYFDILLDKNGICIKDEEVISTDELSKSCNGGGEIQIGCDGSTQNGFTCDKNTTLNKYKVTGLKFTAMDEEECTESWSCTSYSACVGGTQTRTCTDANSCGTTVNKPAESRDCGVSPTGAVVGGEGGSKGSGIIEPSFEVDQDTINLFVKKGDVLRKSIKIVNTGDEVLEFVIDPQHLGEVIAFAESSFVLKGGEERIIEFNIRSGKGIAPGVYVGDILIKAKGLLKIIKTIIEIESEKVLFDINLDIPLDYKKVSPGDEIVLQSTLHNLGGLTNVDILIEYIIKNTKGETILREEETLKVGSQAAFSKRLKLPEDLPWGEYVAIAIVRYENSVGTSTETFNVGRVGGVSNFLNGVIIIGILVIIGLIFGFQRRNLKNIEKLQKTRLGKLAEKKAGIPKPELDKKLNKELELLEKSHKSGFITKMAYTRAKKRINKLK